MIQMKSGDWSLNLEECGADESEDILKEAVWAVKQTKPGYFVNIVTSEAYGDPQETLIPEMLAALLKIHETFREIAFVDRCGCGGYVTRVYK